MSEFKGTKGKWSISDKTAINEHGVKEYLIDSDSGNTSLASVYAPFFGEETEAEEYHSNAQLIASAPELLEALQELVGHFSGFTPLEIEAKAKAEAAINKALGKETSNV